MLSETKDEPDAKPEKRDQFSAANEVDFVDAKRSAEKTPTMTESEFLSQHYVVKDFIGHAVVINNKKFHQKTGMSDRIGSDIDAQKMKSLLTNIGFTVETYDNLKSFEMKDQLQNAASIDHTNSSCFVCVILSHGEEGYVFAHDDRVALDELVSPFKGDKCPSLVGKPKIFLIQACRDPEIDYECADSAGMEPESDPGQMRRIPTEADFLIALSVVPGCLAWKNSTQKGSWFIQAIFDVFSKNWTKLDLMTMMTRVNRIVADEFEKKAEIEFNRRKKQIPCITSMLTKDFYFYRR
ncbi:Caspase-7 [Bulinus truncatus]|nr:Caspase-7 [Bulinus truncatus]